MVFFRECVSVPIRNRNTPVGVLNCRGMFCGLQSPSHRCSRGHTPMCTNTPILHSAARFSNKRTIFSPMLSHILGLRCCKGASLQRPSTEIGYATHTNVHTQDEGDRCLGGSGRKMGRARQAPLGALHDMLHNMFIALLLRAHKVKDDVMDVLFCAMNWKTPTRLVPLASTTTATTARRTRGARTVAERMDIGHGSPTGDASQSCARRTSRPRRIDNPECTGRFPS